MAKADESMVTDQRKLPPSGSNRELWPQGEIINRHTVNRPPEKLRIWRPLVPLRTIWDMGSKQEFGWISPNRVLVAPGSSPIPGSYMMLSTSSQTNVSIYSENTSENTEALGQTEFAVCRNVWNFDNQVWSSRGMLDRDVRAERWSEVMRLEDTTLKVWCWGLRTLRNIFTKRNLSRKESVKEGEQDGGGAGGHEVQLSAQIYQEYIFRHRSACRTPAESRQEYMTSRKEFIEPQKTW